MPKLRSNQHRKTIPKYVKELVWASNIGADKPYGKCFASCGRQIHFMNFEVGHNKALAKGGSNHISNLRPICRSCNQAMGTMSIEDYTREYFSEATRESKTETRQSYKCARSLNGRLIWCGKRKPEKSCLRDNPWTGGKCSDLTIARK